VGGADEEAGRIVAAELGVALDHPDDVTTPPKAAKVGDEAHRLDLVHDDGVLDEHCRCAEPSRPPGQVGVFAVEGPALIEAGEAFEDLPVVRDVARLVEARLVEHLDRVPEGPDLLHGQGIDAGRALCDVGLLQGPNQRVEPSGLDHAVVVSEGDQWRGGQAPPAVAGDRWPRVALEALVPQRVGVRRRDVGDHVGRVVGRRVIDDHDLEPTIEVLVLQAGEQSPQLRRPVVGRDDDRDRVRCHAGHCRISPSLQREGIMHPPSCASSS
jgi:hypothetical protein